MMDVPDICFEHLFVCVWYEIFYERCFDRYGNRVVIDLRESVNIYAGVCLVRLIVGH